jgi:hypothetical protein
MKPRFTVSVFVVTTLLASLAMGQGSLPFSNAIPNRPAVSPYLNLLNPTGSGTSNYFTQVKPQLQAREELVRQQVQINQIQRQVQRGQPGGVPVRGSQEIRGTGHETVFLNYSHYYPIGRRQ